MKKLCFVVFIFCTCTIDVYAMEIQGKCREVTDTTGSCGGKWYPSNKDEIVSNPETDCKYVYNGKETEIDCYDGCHVDTQAIQLGKEYSQEFVLKMDFCLPNVRVCDVNEEGSSDKIGEGYEYWISGSDYTQCFQQSCGKEGYHYEKTGTKYVEIVKKEIEYGECVINEEPCADYFKRKASEPGPTHFYICNNNNSTIEGTRVWLPDDPDDAENYTSGSGSWNYDDCTCTYTTDLEWNTTSRAEIICKYYPGGIEGGTPHWYTPNETNRESDPNKCYVSETIACKEGYCVPNTETECKPTPKGYYNSSDSNKTCAPCPAGTTSAGNTTKIGDCYMTTYGPGTVFEDSSGESLLLYQIGASYDKDNPDSESNKIYYELKSN